MHIVICHGYGWHALLRIKNHLVSPVHNIFILQPEKNLHEHVSSHDTIQ